MSEISRRELLAAGAALAALPCLATEVLAADVPAAKVPKGGIVLLAQLKAKEGQESAVKDALVEMVAPTRKETGCLCYNLHQSKSDKSQFMFYEQWASKEALQAHGKTPHMKTMREKSKGLVAEGNATSFELLG